VDLAAALRRVVEHHGVEAVAKGVALSLEAPPEPLMVRATDQGLARIFGNLVGNGVKYTPTGGSVTVRLGLQGSGATVTVADTGMGIPKDELPRLWTEFFRARNAKQSEIVGTGLGLSIVKRLIASFGGQVSVASEEGKGTSFTVSLPVAAEGEPLAEKARQSA
jgi:two-component system, OmpR family, phosphate regulon sensor histidine kinase PhoR